MDLGVHSFRTGPEEIISVYCSICQQPLDPNQAGTIFSCNSCGENVCNICSKVLENKHYCQNCFSTLPKPVKAAERVKGKTKPAKKPPKKKAKPKKTGKKSSKKKGGKKKEPKKKAKTRKSGGRKSTKETRKSSARGKTKKK
jgi:predicted RNA-binding Zn-ribbon protein involved in translation (DUF1610 family)